MLDVGHDDGSRPKCYFTHSVLPAFLDHDQPSPKKKPFSTIQEHPIVHTLDLMLPTEVSQSFLDKLNGRGSLQYAKLFMKLSDVIEGDFFNGYIKSGNVLMLSEGRYGIDNVFSLREGILRLEVDKATYERTGLNGTSIRSKGRKHVKVRYAIEINLRLPSMVRGKHGFERIIWAFKNVLNRRLVWLFYDLKGANDGAGPLAVHQPIVTKVEPTAESLGGIIVPPLPTEIDEDDRESPTELLEWLTLTMSKCPRVQNGDHIDPYLSRYCIPTLDEETSPSVRNMSRVRWHGFIPAAFVQAVVNAAMKADGEHFFALSSHAFNGKTHTILQHKQHTFTWEFES